MDLSHITDRVIAMSFPASKWSEKLYRNDIDKVSKFFDLQYPDSYWVYNMSNRVVDKEKFHYKVNDYAWLDHHSPALSLLFESCESMFHFIH